MSYDNPIVLNLPDLSDEAIVGIYNFLQHAIDQFETQYFPQMHRYYWELDEEARQHRLEQCKRLREPPPPDKDPPF